MTVNQQTIEGSWNQIKGEIRERWGQLTDDELEEAHGDLDFLVGLIQEKTGEARSEVESFLENSASGFASLAQSSQRERRQSSPAHHGNDAAGCTADGRCRPRELYRNWTPRPQAPRRIVGRLFRAGLITGVIVGLMVHGDRAIVQAERQRLK